MDPDPTRVVPVRQAAPRHFERSVKLVTAALIGGVFLIAGLSAFAQTPFVQTWADQTPPVQNPSTRPSARSGQHPADG